MNPSVILIPVLAISLSGCSRPKDTTQSNEKETTAAIVEPVEVAADTVTAIVFRSPYMHEEDQVYARCTSADHIGQLRDILNAAVPCDQSKFTSPIIRVELVPENRKLLDQDVYDFLRHIEGEHLIFTRASNLYEVPVADIRSWCLSASLDYDAVFIVGSKAKPKDGTDAEQGGAGQPPTRSESE